MSAEVMKFEVECETCCVCGGGGELLTPEEHDAGAHGQVQVPLRTMLLQLNCNKTMPDGRLCANCIRRAMEAYEFSTALSTKGTPPLSEKIRALRRRIVDGPVSERSKLIIPKQNSPATILRCSSKAGYRRRRVTYCQLEALCEFLDVHKDVATGYNKSALDREHAKRMWTRVTNKLNSQGEGAVKTWKEWSNYWVDYKAKLKKRVASVRACQTEDGPSDLLPLSDLENKFLSILESGLREHGSNPQDNPSLSIPQHSNSTSGTYEFEFLPSNDVEDPLEQQQNQQMQDGARERSPIAEDESEPHTPRVARRPRYRKPPISEAAVWRTLIGQEKSRIKLHELTQKIDVFIVVGGAGGGGAGSYSEDDIIMVERDALAAAAAADDEDLERARNARGDSVYQCSVCPLSFQRVSEYRMHLGTHPADAQHSCWTCGAQFARRGALASHAAAHCGAALACHLCGAAAGGAAELRRHEAACPPRCPACAQLFADRAALSAHAHAAHGRAARAARAAGPCVCPTCFRVCDTPELLTAHLLRHRQAKHYVCGYDACILRFATRNNLVAHIRKCHAGSPPAHEPAPAAAGAAAAAAAAGAGAAAAAGAAPHVACDTCGRTFGSMAAMKRHARVHRRANDQHDQMEGGGGGGGEWQEGEAEDMEGEVEYLEVDELDDRFEEKPNIDAML